LYYKWCDAGIFFINDLLDENNEFLSFNRFKEMYGIETTFMQYMGILHMIPQIWKVRIKLTKKTTVITCEHFEYVKKKKNKEEIVIIFLQKNFIKPISTTNKTTRKMERGITYRNCELGSEIQNSFLLYKNNQFSVFQYKILHRILSTNSLLFKCKLKETQLCNFCNETKETILHLF